MRVVFDTNIFVLSQLGHPALAIVEAAFADEWERPLDFFYSEAMLIEYTDTLTKLIQDRYDIFLPTDIQALIAHIQRYGHHVHPTISLAKDDPNACTYAPDNRFLECAIEVEADYIVTVNTDHFPRVYLISSTDHLIHTVPPGHFKDLLFTD